MNDYRSYYDEEEKTSSNPASKLIIGLIVGLILGGAIGFVLGIGSNVDGGVALEGSRVYLVATTIIAVAVISIAIAVKRSAMGLNGGYTPQSTAMRFVVMGLALFLALAFGVYFLLVQ